MHRNMLRTEGNCPYCKAKIFFYYEEEWLYGSPIRTCKKCGKNYVDDRYHEIAVEGIAPNALSIRRNGIGLLVMLGIFLIAFLIHFYEISHKSGYSLEFCCLMVVALFGILFFIIDSIRILTGAKAKKLERLRVESVKRLRNWGYAKELEALGYPVPEEYL
ncbi:MAG: hypothetical protein HDR22_00440 [Lachnospiraceae bacterium]|nr:hypothetical protein [Lachnospiraceae bacterium]